MKITHFLYNAFLIEHGATKVAIDPGQNLWMLNLSSLIPKSQWDGVTHVFVTHGDPDHYWQADRIASATNAPLVLNREMVRAHGPHSQILAPRRGGLKFVPFSGQLVALDVGESTEVNGVQVRAIKTLHGPIEVNLLGFKHRVTPGPGERVGFGAMGFEIRIGNITIVNLGDSLLQEEWNRLNPDILMLPIGGLGNQTWTMDTADARVAVQMMNPRLVIPCHYNVPFLWKKIMAPADVCQFKRDIESLGMQCEVMSRGAQVEYFSVP